MRSTAIAKRMDYAEVLVSSTAEVLESNVIALRNDLNEFKTETRSAFVRVDTRFERLEMRAGTLEATVVRLDTRVGTLEAAVAKLDADLNAAAEKLHAEIRASAEKAGRDLKEFADRIERQFAEMRTTHAEMRADHKALCAKVDATNDRLSALEGKFKDFDSKLNALLWAMGGVGALIMVATAVVTALN